MSSNRLRNAWPPRIKFLAIVLVFVFFTLNARAQVAGADAPPPVRTFIDSNGVDLSTGTLYFADRQLSVGQPDQGGLERIYLGDVFGRDNLTGTINTSTSSASIYIVSLGTASYSFNQSGQTFTNLNGDGSTLTLTNSTTYTFVGRDGTIAVFSTTFHGGCCVLASVARVASVTKPNGQVLTYSYSSHTVTVSGLPIPINRIEAVMNNFGYEIKYLYTNANTIAGYAYPAEVLGINNTVDYCAPTATTCSGLTVAWPAVSISTNASNAATITDNLGRQTIYPQTPAPSTTITFTRPSGQSISITYDASTRVGSISNGVGTWKYVYSTSGSTLTTTVTDPNNHTRVVATNTSNSTVLSDTDGVGNKTAFAYDTYGRLQTITRQEGDTIGYTYDGRGNITQTVNTGKDHTSTITTSANFDTACTYPAKCNQPNWTKDGRGYETDYTYNTSTGQPLSIIQPAGANGLRPESDFTYSNQYAWYKNSTGTIVQAAFPISMLTKASQCATAQTCAGTANAVQSTFLYGTPGVANNLLITSATQGAGDGSLVAVTGLTYDTIGNLYTQTDPLSRVTRYRFDAVRQLVGIVGPDPDGSGPLHNRAMRLTYECDSSIKSGCDGLVTKVEQGTVLSETDADWAGFSALGQKAVSYDGVDRKATDVTSSGSTYISAFQYSYDAGNRLTCSAQRMNASALSSLPASACSLGTQGPAGPDRITNLTYDNANKLLKTTVGYGTSVQADAEITTYGGDGESLTKADAKGHLTTLVHDTFNRISQVELPTPSNGGVSSTTDYEQYTYDNNGNITQNRRRDGTLVNYGYDALNLRTSGYNGTTFGYDNLERMTSAVVSGNSESFSYDGLNRQISETGPLGTVGRKYDLVGNLTRLTYPDNYYVIYGYDAANEFTGLTDSNSTTLLQQVYDNLARISSISRTSGPSESRGYGSDLRLSSQAYTFTDTSKNVAYSYTYNLAGQPMTMTPNNAAYSNITSPAAASYASDGQNRYTTVGGHTMTYDGRSNLNNDGTNAFIFDGLNRATTVNSTTFTYDAIDRVYQGTKGSSTNRLLYSGQQVIAAYDGSGNLLNRYVPDLFLDRTLLGYSGTGTAVSGAIWLVTNAFGSVVAGAYSGTAAITTYDAFGVSGASGLSPVNGNFGFKGMPSSGSSGIYSVRARTYSAGLGRFLQPDPAGYTDGLHLYQFVHNSPVSGSDPLGLDDGYCYDTDDGIECSPVTSPALPPDPSPDPSTDPNPGYNPQPSNPGFTAPSPAATLQHGGGTQSQNTGCTNSSGTRSTSDKITDAIVGFGDAFLIPILVRNLTGIGNGTVDTSSSAYTGGEIAGTIEGLIPLALEGAASYSAAQATRGTPSILNANQYFRIGPGRFGGDMVPRISSPYLPGDGHFSLSTRVPPIPPLGALAHNGC